MSLPVSKAFWQSSPEIVFYNFHQKSCSQSLSISYNSPPKNNPTYLISRFSWKVIPKKCPLFLRWCCRLPRWWWTSAELQGVELYRRDFCGFVGRLFFYKWTIFPKLLLINGYERLLIAWFWYALNPMMNGIPFGRLSNGSHGHLVPLAR